MSAQIDLADLATVTPERAVFDIEQLRQRASLTMLFGPSNAGKSITELAITAHMLCGSESVLGHRIARPYRRVLWLSAEEKHSELRWRFDAVARGHGLPPLKAGQLLHVWTSAPTRHVYLDEIAVLVEQHEPDAVVVDPLTNVLPRGKVTNDNDFSRVEWDKDAIAVDTMCAELRRVSINYGTNITLIHHENAGGQRERGSTVWRNSVDTVVKLNAHGVLDVQKQRNGARPPKRTLHLEWREDAVRILPVKDFAASACLATVERELERLGRATLADLEQATQYKQTAIKEALAACPSAAKAEQGGGRGKPTVWEWRAGP